MYFSDSLVSLPGVYDEADALQALDARLVLGALGAEHGGEAGAG